MSTHIYDELPWLLTGEADRATVDAAATHLRTCEDCQQELVAMLVAHASLSSAARYAPELMASLPSPLAQPLEDEADGTLAVGRELPDLSAVFAQVRDEAAAATPRVTATPAPRRAWRGSWLAAAAVTGIALGGGVVVVAEHANDRPSERSFALAAYDTGTTPAKATIVGSDKIKVDATSLPSPASGKRYEVWLTDATRKNLQPLGWVGTDGKGSYTVPPDLIGHFNNIEVSVQQVDAPYQFSGVSVLRGSYA
ncbi:MAG: anti-sigma factor [Actinomycetota bacterium]